MKLFDLKGHTFELELDFVHSFLILKERYKYFESKRHQFAILSKGQGPKGS